MNPLDNWINSDLEKEFRETQKVKPLELVVRFLINKAIENSTDDNSNAISDEIISELEAKGTDSNQIAYIKSLLKA